MSNQFGDRVFLTREEALGVVATGDIVHTFRGGGACLIGAYWDRSEVTRAITRATGKRALELAGETAIAMGHGLVLHDGGSPLFIATDQNALAKLDPGED